MAFGVFIHRTDSIYDDVPSERYQFPKQYLSRAQDCEGDWIVYLEPSKVKGTKGYFAVARVQEIISDPRHADMHLAVIEPGTYLDFGDPVPFRDAGDVVEQGLLNDQGKISGRAQAAVRPLSPADFARIVERGLGGDDDILPRVDLAGIDLAGAADGFGEAQRPFQHLSARERVRQLTNRAMRDRNFRRNVLRAECGGTETRIIYDCYCGFLSRKRRAGDAKASASGGDALQRTAKATYPAPLQVPRMSLRALCDAPHHSSPRA